MKLKLYTMRMDCPLTTPIKNDYLNFFKLMECKTWLIGCEEAKKDTGKIHFHVVAYMKQSENTVRKKFKNIISSFPTWGDPNSFSCAIKKKENKSILEKKKKYKSDIINILSYPIKEVKNIDEFIIQKTFRGFPKKRIIELHLHRKNHSLKKEIITKRKTTNDYLLIWEEVKKIKTENETILNIVISISNCILTYYTLIGKKIPYRSYIKSMMNSYMIKLDLYNYKDYYAKSLAREFLEDHQTYVNLDTPCDPHYKKPMNKKITPELLWDEGMFKVTF